MIAIETHQHISHEEMLREFEIVREAARDPARFQVLYDKYFAAIFNFIYRRTDDEELAADLTSQTFLKALGGLKKYKFRGVPFSAWLYRIASNEVNRHYRSSRKKLVFSFDESEFENLISESTDQVEELDIERITQLMLTMSESDIEVLELRFFESKCFAEIAFILDITEATAKMRTYRAIEKLRKLMERRNR